MQSVPDSQTAHAFAQELVTKTQQLKALSLEIIQIKLELYDAAAGGITCTGGRVLFVQAVTSARLDKDELKRKLISERAMSETEAEAFIASCSPQSSRAPYVAVYLD